MWVEILVFVIVFSLIGGLGGLGYWLSNRQPATLPPTPPPITPLPAPDAPSAPIKSLTAGSGSGTGLEVPVCVQFPDSPNCRPPPPVAPTQTGLETCVPPGGMWSTPGTGIAGRSSLASPCCQPPLYELGREKPYKTCNDNLSLSDPTEKCVAECCANAALEANNYDPSWYPMARCACSLWCYNQQVPHFKKYGTAVHYITGDLAEAQTSDSPNFIGAGDAQGIGIDFSGKTNKPTHF